MALLQRANSPAWYTLRATSPTHPAAVPRPTPPRHRTRCGLRACRTQRDVLLPARHYGRSRKTTGCDGSREIDFPGVGDRDDDRVTRLGKISPRRRPCAAAAGRASNHRRRPTSGQTNRRQCSGLSAQQHEGASSDADSPCVLRPRSPTAHRDALRR